MVHSLGGITVTQATELTDDLYLACQRLIPQLTSINPPPTPGDLAQIISSSSSILFFAKHTDFGHEVIGIATLILYRVPTGQRAYIEDVVVEEKARGRNVGEALTLACLERARQGGASQAMLTCNPGRLAANKLYQRVGFELRKTNVYRYNLKQR
jgi:ribosomal protein S18 acetylase RimI-like enzyme